MYAPHRYVTRGVLCFALFVLAGCAGTPQLLKYQVDPAAAPIWPLPPEQPRYRYVGQLTGEFDLVEDREHRGFSDYFVDFFRFLVGLASEQRIDPMVLQRPQSGTIDDLGRILVTDVSRHSVMVFDEKQGQLLEWQLAVPERAFLTPVGIVTGENGTVYVADADLGYVVHLDGNGEPLRHFGEEQLDRPTGLARDPDKKQLYVADTHAHNIKIYSDDGLYLGTIGKRGEAAGEFNSPTHLSFSKGKLYVTDTFNTRVQILNADGEVQHNFGKRGENIGDLVRPKGVSTDSDGNIYVIESFHDYLLVYNAKGELLLPIGGTGSEVGQFYLPSGIWSDKKDRIYIADMFNGRIVVLQYLKGSKTELVQ